MLFSKSNRNEASRYVSEILREKIRCIKLMSTEKIKTGTFKDYKRLEIVEISEGTKEIEPKAFENCERITRLVIPDSVTKLENDFIFECVNLKSFKCKEEFLQYLPKKHSVNTFKL